MVSRRASHPAANSEGQAFIEYILLLAIVVGTYIAVVQGLVRLRIAQKISKPITQDFAYTYRYGNAKTRGYEDGGPINHPRAITGDTDTKNFRLFINRIPGGS